MARATCRHAPSSVMVSRWNAAKPWRGATRCWSSSVRFRLFPVRSTRSSSASARIWWRRSRAVRAGSCARAMGHWHVLRSRTVRLLPTSPRRRPSWMTRSAYWFSLMPVARGAAITPNSRRETSACACIICWNRAGRPMPPFRGWAAPTEPIRRSRRCSGPSPRMSKPRNASSRPSPAASTRWARSPAASARPAVRGCSVPRIISNPPMPATRCASSIC